MLAMVEDTEYDVPGQDSVLINIVNNNGEDRIIEGHKHDRVLINIVNSNRVDVTIKGHKQDRVLINIVNNNGEYMII